MILTDRSCAPAGIMLGLLLSCPGVSSAQPSAGGFVSFVQGTTGLKLYDASASALYDTLGGRSGSGFLGAGLTQTGDTLITGSATMGWTHRSERANFGLTYSPMYLTRWKYPDENTVSHSLSFAADRELSRNWVFRASSAAAYMTAEQLLFSPTAFSRAASTPANFDDFAAEFLRRPFTNALVASMITGTPAAESPARTLFYGNRIFSSLASATLSYRASPRTTITAGFGGTRTESFPSSREREANSVALVGKTTGATADLSISQSLTPRTEVGVSVNANRYGSPVQDALRTSVNGFVGRRMGVHWVAQIHGGAGQIRTLRTTFVAPKGLQAQGGGSIAYHTFAHTIMGSTERTFGDSLGLGAGSMLSTSAAWNWAHPRRSWSVHSSFGQQGFLGGPVANLRSWQTATGVTKQLGAHLSHAIDYAYLRYSSALSARPFAIHAVRVSLMWRPGPNAVK